MKKFGKYLVAGALMVAVMAVGFVGCKGNKSGPLNLKKTSNVIAMSTVSSANMLSNIVSGGTTKASKVAKTAAAAADKTDLTKAEIDDINKQIQTFETFIGSNPIDVKNEVSDRAEYKHKMTMNLKDLSGTPASYVLYYNETKITDGGTTVAADNEKDEDEEVKAMDAEQEFSMDGIMVFDGAEYTITGEKELEEGEYEMKITASFGDNKILIEQEIEEEEQELTYTIYKAGAVVSSFSMELEVEKDEVEVLTSSTVNGAVVTRRFSKEVENGESVIKISQTENGKTLSAKVVVTKDANGKDVYKYTTAAGQEVIEED
ncbi:MAG: hypothetical protein RR348_02460 [Clostridia bacterium]